MENPSAHNSATDRAAWGVAGEGGGEKRWQDRDSRVRLTRDREAGPQDCSSGHTQKELGLDPAS